MADPLHPAKLAPLRSRPRSAVSRRSYSESGSRGSLAAWLAVAA